MDFAQYLDVGTIIGICGILIAVYQYRKNSPPSLRFCYSGNRIIDKENVYNDKSLQIKFDGYEIPRLSSTNIIVWNGGGKSIHQKDFVENHPVLVSFGDDSEVVKSEVIKFTNKSNDFEIYNTEKKDSIGIRFSYLNSKDGALIRIFHTGKVIKPSFSGAIVGLNKGIEFSGKIFVSLQKQNLIDDMGRLNKGIIFIDKFFSIVGRPFLVVLSLFGLLMAAGGIFPAFLSDIGIIDHIVIGADRFILLFMGGSYALFPTYFLWRIRKRYPSKLHPEDDTVL